jgi:hypothetical protein
MHLPTIAAAVFLALGAILVVGNYVGIAHARRKHIGFSCIPILRGLVGTRWLSPVSSHRGRRPIMHLPQGNAPIFEKSRFCFTCRCRSNSTSAGCCRRCRSHSIAPSSWGLAQPFIDSQNGVAPPFPRFLREGGPSVPTTICMNARQTSSLPEPRLPPLHHF